MELVPITGYLLFKNCFFLILSKNVIIIITSIIFFIFLLIKSLTVKNYKNIMYS